MSEDTNLPPASPSTGSAPEAPVGIDASLLLSDDAQAEPTVPSYERSDRVAQKRSRTVRLAVLAAGLAIITAIGYFHQTGVAVKTVGVDALCPFGGIETFWSLIAGGGLLQRIAISSVILLGVILVTAVFFRRSFCGYICPLGALQEYFGKIRKLFPGTRRAVVPAAIDKPARYLKYLVLAFFTVWTWQAATLVIRPYDPWVAYMHLTSGELFAEFGIGLGILAVSLVGSVVYDRFFCKYLCPMGAFLGVVSKVSVFKVRRNAETCIDCGACDKACPTNLAVSHMETVSSAECINCNECVNSCPVAHTLEVADAPFGRKRTALAPATVLGATVLIIALFVGGTTLTGAFAWTIPTLSQTIEQSGGAFNPEDIKGRMSFAEIASATGIAPGVLEQRFGVKPSDMTVPIKDLAPVYGFDVHTDVREFVAATLESMSAQSGTTGTEAAPAGED